MILSLGSTDSSSAAGSTDQCQTVKEWFKEKESNPKLHQITKYPFPNRWT